MKIGATRTRSPTGFASIDRRPSRPPTTRAAVQITTPATSVAQYVHQARTSAARSVALDDDHAPLTSAVAHRPDRVVVVRVVPSARRVDRIELDDYQAFRIPMTLENLGRTAPGEVAPAVADDARTCLLAVGGRFLGIRRSNIDNEVRRHGSAGVVRHLIEGDRRRQDERDVLVRTDLD